jgi:pseudouridine-5'-phosphate glycosidase/pseudouridine kinase
MSALEQEGLDTASVIKAPLLDSKTGVPNRTAQYVAVNDAKKDLVVAMADMALFSNIDNRDLLLPRSTTYQASHKPKWVVIDANLNSLIARQIFSRYKSLGVKTAFEPVSVAKSSSIFNASPTTSPQKVLLEVFPNHLIDLATPNKHELAAMHASAKKQEYFESDSWWHVIDSLGIPSSGARDRFVALTSREMTDKGIPLQTIQLLPFLPTILTKLGSEGVLLTELLTPDDGRLTDPRSAPYILSRTSNGSTKAGGVYMRLFPAVEVVDDIVSVNGVGDTFLGVLVAGLAKGVRLDEKLIEVAQRGAVMTLRSKEAVSPELGVLREELDELVRDASIARRPWFDPYLNPEIMNDAW